MAMDKQNVTGNGAAPASTPTKKKEAPASSPSFGGGGVWDILNNSLKCSVMTQAAEDHLVDLQKKLADGGTNTTATKIPFDTFECVVLACPKTRLGVALLYSEAFNPDAVKSLGEIKTEIVKKNLDVAINQPILVVPDDYPRVANLAKFIQLQIGYDRQYVRTDISTWLYTDDTKKDRLQLIVTNKMSNVRDVIAKLSPHSTPARCDYGIAIYITNRSTFQFKDKQNMNYADLTPVMAISAYNKFIPAGNTGKYIPISTISEIVSAIPDPGFMILGLQLAIDRFIVGQDWLSPYKTYGKDDINLGNLTMVEGKMGQISNDDEKKKLVEELFTDVWCSLDYVIGRCTIPGIERFDPSFGAEAQMSSRQFVANFLGIPVENTPNIVKHSFEGTTGYIAAPGSRGVGGDMADARSVDFLKMAANGIKDFQKLMFFLQPVPAPKLMNEFLSTHFTYNELFILKNFILDPEAHVLIRNYMQDLSVYLDVADQEMMNLNQNLSAVFGFSGAKSNYGSGQLGSTGGMFGGSTTKNVLWE